MRHIENMSHLEALQEEAAVTGVVLAHILLIAIALCAAFVTSFWADQHLLISGAGAGTFLFINSGLSSVVDCAQEYKDALKRIYSQDTD